MRTVAILPIRLYQVLVSPLLPANTCKYHPSCSEYAVLAIRTHGILRGVPMAAWRLLRCNPWSHGGVDYPRGVGSTELHKERRHRLRRRRSGDSGVGSTEPKC